MPALAGNSSFIFVLPLITPRSLSRGFLFINGCCFDAMHCVSRVLEEVSIQTFKPLSHEDTK